MGVSQHNKTPNLRANEKAIMNQPPHQASAQAIMLTGTDICLWLAEIHLTLTKIQEQLEDA